MKKQIFSSFLSVLLFQIMITLFIYRVVQEDRRWYYFAMMGLLAAQIILQWYKFSRYIKNNEGELPHTQGYVASIK